MEDPIKSCATSGFLMRNSLVQALSDTFIGAPHTVRFFWVVEVFGGIVVGTILGWVLTPVDPTKWESFLYPLLGAVLGIITPVLLLLLFNLHVAPYRQRDQALSQLEETRTELSGLINDIAYALEVREVVANWPPDREAAGVILRLRNRAGRPLRYQVITIACMIDQANAEQVMLGNGGIIYSEIDFIMSALFPGMISTERHEGVVIFTIFYGFPDDHARRRLDVSATITFDHQTTTFYWNRRDEQPVDIPFTGEAPSWQSVPYTLSSQNAAASQ